MSDEHEMGMSLIKQEMEIKALKDKLDKIKEFVNFQLKEIPEHYDFECDEKRELMDGIKEILK